MPARADHVHALPAVIAGCLLACACESSVVLKVGVSEQEAARTVAILQAHHIGAQRAPHVGPATMPATVDLRVHGADVAEACSVLGAQPLRSDAAPSRNPPSAFIPTPAEERARITDATASDLEHTIALWAGVTDVRVQVAEATSSTALDAEPLPPRVAVTVAHLPDQAPDVRAIRQLVKHVVTGSDEGAILVSLVATPPRAVRQLVQIGPITVTSASAPLLKLAWAILLTLTTTLAGLLLWTMRKARLARD